MKIPCSTICLSLKKSDPSIAIQIFCSATLRLHYRNQKCFPGREWRYMPSSVWGQSPAVHHLTSTSSIPFQTWFPHTDWLARAAESPWQDPESNLDMALVGLHCLLIVMFTTLEFVSQSTVHRTINNSYHTELTCYYDASKTAAKNSNLSQAISLTVPWGFCRNLLSQEPGSRCPILFQEVE